jgi:PKD repeat protein
LKLVVLVDNSRTMTTNGVDGSYNVFRKTCKVIADRVSRWDADGRIPKDSQLEVYAVSNPDLKIFTREEKHLREPLFKYGEPPQDYKALDEGRGISVGSLPWVSDLKLIQQNDLQPFQERGYWVLFFSNTSRDSADGRSWWGALKKRSDLATSSFMLPVILPNGRLDRFSMDRAVEKAVGDAFDEVSEFWKNASVATATVTWVEPRLRTVDMATVEGTVVRIPGLVTIEKGEGRMPHVTLEPPAHEPGTVARAVYVDTDFRKHDSVTGALGKYAFEIELREPLIDKTVTITASVTGGGATRLEGDTRAEIVLKGRPMPHLFFNANEVAVRDRRGVIPVVASELIVPIDLAVRGEGGAGPAKRTVTVRPNQQELILDWQEDAVLPDRIGFVVGSGQAILCFADRRRQDPLYIAVKKDVRDAPPEAPETPGPTAAIHVTPDPADVTVSTGDSLTFSAEVTQGDRLTWEFGDGTEAVAGVPEVRHSFAEPGQYTVVLTARNAAGQVARATQAITVAARVEPEAKFRFSPALTTIPVGTPVAFENQSSNATSYEWEFGDGSPGSTEPNPTHTYSRPGTYMVTLVAHAGDRSNRYAVEITMAGAGGESAVAADPVAAFELASEGAIEAGDSVRFVNRSSNADRFEWDFGDGTPPVSEREPSHVFDHDGVFTVRLIAYGGDGRSHSHEQTVTVSEGGSILPWVLLLLVLGVIAMVIKFLRPTHEVSASLFKGKDRMGEARTRKSLLLADVGLPDLSSEGKPQAIVMSVDYDKEARELQVKFVAKGYSCTLKRVDSIHKTYNLPADTPSTPVPLGEYEIEGTDYRLRLEDARGEP